MGQCLLVFLLFLLTSLPLFLFLGEAERYINHVSYFVIASFVYTCNEMGFSYLVYLTLLHGLIFILEFLFYPVPKIKRNENLSLISFIKQQI